MSGQPRSYRKAFPFIKTNLLDRYDVDVFAHAWRPEGANLGIYVDLQEIYKPINFITEEKLSDGINSDLAVPNASHPANFCTSMFYSIYRSNEFRLRRETLLNKKYDFVIRCRYDFALNKKIDFESLEKGKIYVSKDTDGPNPLLNDQFAIGDSESMNVYSSTFLFLRWHYNRNVSLCGHSMLESQLRHFNISVERIDIDHPFTDGKFNIGNHSLIRDDMNKWIDIKIWGY
jgi:hypothetical protein